MSPSTNNTEWGQFFHIGSIAYVTLYNSIFYTSTMSVPKKNMFVAPANALLLQALIWRPWLLIPGSERYHKCPFPGCETRCLCQESVCVPFPVISAPVESSPVSTPATRHLHLLQIPYSVVHQPRRSTPWFINLALAHIHNSFVYIFTITNTITFTFTFPLTSTSTTLSFIFSVNYYGFWVYYQSTDSEWFFYFYTSSIDF